MVGLYVMIKNSKEEIMEKFKLSDNFINKYKRRKAPLVLMVLVNWFT